jgi:hypothetical protein
MFIKATAPPAGMLKPSTRAGATMSSSASHTRALAAMLPLFIPKIVTVLQEGYRPQDLRADIFPA